MNTALILSALLMGVASGPHCLAMCSALCGGVARACGGTRPGQGMAALQLGRLISYASAGALVAASVSALGAWSQYTPALRPVWGLLQLAALALGLWLVWRGQVPMWMQHVGRGVTARLAQASDETPRWRVWRAGGLGLLWALWPCGLLQAALVVAALSPTPLQGALAMAAFALGSGVSLWLGPALWWRWSRGHLDVRSGPTLAVRLSGVMLAAVSAWGVGLTLWQRLNPTLC